MANPPDEASVEAGKRAFLDMARMHMMSFVARFEGPIEVTEQRRLKARGELMLDIARDLNLLGRELKAASVATHPQNKSGIAVAGNDPDRLPSDPKPTGQLGKVLDLLARTRPPSPVGRP